MSKNLGDVANTTSGFLNQWNIGVATQLMMHLKC